MSDANQIRKILQERFNEIGDEARDQILLMTYRLGIGAAILFTNYSQDFDVLAKKLFEIKQGAVTEKEFKIIVKREYPGMMAEGLVLPDGTLSDEWEFIVKDHEKNLDEGK